MDNRIRRIDDFVIKDVDDDYTEIIIRKSGAIFQHLAEDFHWWFEDNGVTVYVVETIWGKTYCYKKVM